VRSEGERAERSSACDLRRTRPLRAQEIVTFGGGGERLTNDGLLRGGA
jgi:hypothetical protein